MRDDARRTTPAGWSVRRDDALEAAAERAGLWREETLAEHLRREATSDPDRTLLSDGEQTLTAAALLADAERLARAMLARFPAGSVVSFMLPNWIEAATIYAGATLAGMAAHPILPSLRDRDLAFMLQDIGSRAIFVPAQFRKHDYAAMLHRVCEDLADPPLVVVLRGDAAGHTAYRDLLESGGGDAAPPALDPREVRMVMYTSGTTGRPKGVMHTHQTLGALIRQLGDRWLVEPGDSFLVASPVSHIGGSIYAFEMPPMLGIEAVLMESWDPAEAVRLIESRGITHMAGATPFLQGLLTAARAAGTRLPSLKVFICGGASVPPSLIREATDYFPNACVTRVYGSTEVPVTTVGVLDRTRVDLAAETDGAPGIAEVRLGESDEILARGPQMFAGYVHAEDEDGAFTPEGFYRTGDQGAWVQGDHLVVTGRLKDLIIRNGENIAPKEIEDLLLDHPDIADVAVVGIPDDRTGERAVAVIVPRANASPDVGTLAAHLATRGVAKFKYPEAVELRDALPKNDAGKVLKVKLREELA